MCTEPRVFMSHNHAQAALAIAISAVLRKCAPGGVFCYETTVTGSITGQMAEELTRCTHMVVIVGETISKHQKNEIDNFLARQPGLAFSKLVDCREDPKSSLPPDLGLLQAAVRIQPPAADPTTAGVHVAREIARQFGFRWVYDGLPANPHLFDYEKDIIRFYVGLPPREDEPDPHMRYLDGAPLEWPQVPRLFDEDTGSAIENRDTLKEIVGEWRDPAARVAAASLSGITSAKVYFPEAGPRRHHFFPRPGARGLLNVGVLVSGGIAPGINSVIDGITTRHFLYADHNGYTVQVIGFLNGFRAFDGVIGSTVNLVPGSGFPQAGPTRVTAQSAAEGGSILGTSRADRLTDPVRRGGALTRIVAAIYGFPLDILYVIGGDGSMKAAHAIWSCAKDYAEQQALNRRISVVSVPKTMDNDILWVWQSFGFLSAVEKAREVIEDLSTEVRSNPRLCIIQLFGSDSGFVVSHAVLASHGDLCDAALIPEVPFSMHKLAEWIMQRMASRRQGIPAGMVVMAETAIPTDAMDFIDDEQIGLNVEEKSAIREFEALRKEGKRIQGQTNDRLRSGGLKIVSRGLEKLIKSGEITVQSPFPTPDWNSLRVFTNEPRHLLRAIPPSCVDIISGQRLGTLAVDNALAGYTDFMISQWLTEYVLVPLDLVVLGRKRIPREGVFWRSVRAKTRQPDLV